MALKASRRSRIIFQRPWTSVASAGPRKPIPMTAIGMDLSSDRTDAQFGCSWCPSGMFEEGMLPSPVGLLGDKDKAVMASSACQFDEGRSYWGSSKEGGEFAVLSFLLLFCLD